MNIKFISKAFQASTRADKRWLLARHESHLAGQVIHGYKVEHSEFIPEFNITPIYLRHEATGAEHLHIEKLNDSNNVFAVSLRTTPKSSNGVAHILEHLALCGSKNYAVRDPFFKMTTRSLATFMNAMTGPDFTVYPFSTQNEKDFENLLRVYADAVFFPRLRPVDFRQEGWRLEHEKPDKKDTPIVIRGVVYNEMKGVFSSSSSIYARHLLNSLFPETTYQYESGGHPDDIPSLSHDDLKKFHKLHYHPTNAKFFTYGDIKLETHLKLLNEIVMSRFSENSQAKEQSVVTEQPLWTQTRSVDITCPPDPMCPEPGKQTTTSVAYVLPTSITNLDDMFPLLILSNLLIEGPNAPFYKSLKESGLGSDFSPTTGLGTYTRQPYFSVGLQNIHQDDVTKVHEIIESTLKQACVDGFPDERIEATLHGIELGLKHITGSFGLRILMNLESFWNQDGNPFDYLKVNDQVERFKRNLAGDKKYWAKLIERYFLQNKHKLILNMSPDERFEEHREEREKYLLEDKIAKLNDVDRQTVLYEGMELMKIQNAKDDVSILPCLDPSKDISRDLKDRQQESLTLDTYKDIKIQLCIRDCNEVVYFRALTDLKEKLGDGELLDYLPLFCDVATKFGAGPLDRHQFDQQSQLSTGGLGVSLTINPSLEKLDEFKNEVFIGSHCLRRNVNAMFELWLYVYEQVYFQQNKELLSQLIKASAAELAEGIPHSGNMYATKRAASTISTICKLDERLSGLTFVTRMKEMASKESVDQIAKKLQIIAGLAFDPFSMRCSINADQASMGDASDGLKRFIDRAQASFKKSDFRSGAKMDHEVEDMKFPFATHYVAKSLLTVPKMHVDHPKLVIMSKLISSKFLLREVREKGGAYGAAVRLSNTGALNFSSYRDPNTTRTLETFDRSVDWLSDKTAYTDKDIEESKLGVFQSVDKPIAPGNVGMNFFTLGETDRMREDYRRRLLDVSRKDVIEVGERYLRQEKKGVFVI